ncbi:glycosyltransferase [Ancylomarina longa]|uniref:Glycosyltransferase n=1 Tax=Ancylomarina longa TaxID=2487017 RepID=A0A434AX57_9BACT|nr:glycosyltransferase [Ancylomarina longa]RUT79114.1 glycosyltransferase [Ancylomarina longa]
MSLAIVVPCYNEFDRLPKAKFIQFLQNNKDCSIIFSDDGSTDNTNQLLEQIRKTAPDNVFINTLIKNRGKAHAVREGVLFCSRNKLEFEKIAYLDADLSTSLEECLLISQEIKESVYFAFGSRISKIDNNITRKLYRHLIGRFTATLISNVLGLAVYDTQCGCKIFTKNLANEVFEEDFISKWLFDVEIFYRIIQLKGKEKMRQSSREIPLQTWIDTDGSKVSFTYFFKMWKDLFLIYKRYNEKKK